MTTAAKGALALSLCLTLAGLSGPSYAYDNYLKGSASRHTQTSGTKQFFQEHPKVRSAAIGAGVGTAAGAVTGLVTGKGVVRGAAIGAGAGAGVGLIRSSKTLKHHPIIKDVATGTVTGLGLGLAGSRGHGKGKKVAQATGVGAAVGLAAGLLRDKLR